MIENDLAHQGEETDQLATPEGELEDSIDLEEYENDSPSDELEDDSEGEDSQELSDEIPELGIENASEEDKSLWNQRWKGVLKREKRLAEETAKVQMFLNHEENIRYLIETGRKLADRATGLSEMSSIVGELKARHGYKDEDIAQALGLTKAPEPESYEFDSDEEIYRRAKEDAMNELEAKYGGKISKWEETEKQREEAQKLSNFVDQNHKRIKDRLRDLTGVSVNLSKSQIEKAILAKPEVAKDDPADAVYLYYKDLIKKAQAKKARTSGKRGPEALKGSPRSGSGLSKKSDREMTFSEAARARGLDPKQVIEDMFG